MKTMTTKTIDRMRQLGRPVSRRGFLSSAAGVATASGDWGSALLTVSAGELRSTPVTVLVADRVDGAITVDDSAVAGAEAVNPEAEVEVVRADGRIAAVVVRCRCGRTHKLELVGEGVQPSPTEGTNS